MPYTFKKSKLALNTAAAFVLMSSLGAQVTFAAHTYDEATKTDTYTNQLISESRGGDPNDIKGYNHADRKLVLIWDGNPDRKDGAAIRGATVVADEITINTDFVKANAFSGKSIISSGNDVTHITANKISVQSGDDAIYTESNGTVTIDGFSELKVSSQSDIRWGGHGIVDNGTGITLIGKDDSTIEVNSRQNAMGNGYVSGPIGKGITASAGKIILTSTGNALGATAVGKSPFVIDVNAKEVSLSGENHAAYAQYKGTIKINQKVKEGSLKAEGSFVASRDGSIEANLGGTGSYIKHGSDGLAVSAGQVSYAEDSAGKVTLNSTGSEHYIDGLLEAINEGSTLTINSTGENFKLSNTTPDATYLAKARSTIHLVAPMRPLQAISSRRLVAKRGSLCVAITLTSQATFSRSGWTALAPLIHSKSVQRKITPRSRFVVGETTPPSRVTSPLKLANQRLKCSLSAITPL